MDLVFGYVELLMQVSRVHGALFHLVSNLTRRHHAVWRELHAGIIEALSDVFGGVNKTLALLRCTHRVHLSKVIFEATVCIQDGGTIFTLKFRYDLFGLSVHCVIKEVMDDRFLLCLDLLLLSGKVVADLLHEDLLMVARSGSCVP